MPEMINKTDDEYARALALWDAGTQEQRQKAFYCVYKKFTSHELPDSNFSYGAQALADMIAMTVPQDALETIFGSK
jgi:hypothetical protein